jgi:hypothetical protein
MLGTDTVRMKGSTIVRPVIRDYHDIVLMI